MAITERGFRDGPRNGDVEIIGACSRLPLDYQNDRDTCRPLAEGHFPTRLVWLDCAVVAASAKEMILCPAYCMSISVKASFLPPSFDVVFRNVISASIGTNDGRGPPLLTSRYYNRRRDRQL